MTVTRMFTENLEISGSIFVNKALEGNVYKSIVKNIILIYKYYYAIVFPFQGVQEKGNLTSPLLSTDDPIFSSLSKKLGRSVDEVGDHIYQSLLRVSFICVS